MNAHPRNVLGLCGLVAIALCAGCRPDSGSTEPYVAGDSSLQVGTYQAGANVTVWDRLFEGHLEVLGSGCASITVGGTVYLPVFEAGTSVDGGRIVVDADRPGLAVGDTFTFSGMPGDSLVDLPNFVLPPQCEDDYPAFFIDEVLLD